MKTARLIAIPGLSLAAALGFAPAALAQPVEAPEAPSSTQVNANYQDNTVGNVGGDNFQENWNRQANSDTSEGNGGSSEQANYNDQSNSAGDVGGNNTQVNVNDQSNSKGTPPE